ncbi:MAG: EAL domain-containing protein [Pseudomonadales bacterium]
MTQGKPQKREVSAILGSRFGRFLLQAWLLVAVSVVGVSELYWLPSAVEQRLNRQVIQYQYQLKLASRLAQADDHDVHRGQILQQFNRNAANLGWLELVYDTEQKLRQRALSNAEQQLLLQPIPNSESAYGLWFDPEQVVRAELFTYRVFEAVLLCIVSLIFIVFWLRRAHLMRALEKITTAARSLSEGDFSTPFPKVDDSSTLSELIDTFEHARKSLARMRRELIAQVQAKRLSEQRLNDSHEVAKLGCWEWRIQADEIWFSPSMMNILALGKLEVGCSLEQFFSHVHPADKKHLEQQLRNNLHVGKVLSLDFRVSTTDVKHVHLAASVKAQKSGQLRLIGTCQDISERKDIESSLQKLSSAISSSGSGVIVTDVLGAVEYINPKFTETTGFELEELLGTTSVMLSRECLPEDKYDTMWRDILSGKSWRGDLENIRKDGSSYWSIVSISPINNEYGELTHFVIVSEDVSELKDAHAQMEKLALYDELTGLPNRRLFFRELAQLFKAKVLESPAVVMLLDLDHFKTVNDTQGHPAGDTLLIEVARRLAQNLQERDIAARLGGDEFAILINPVKDLAQVERMAERVLKDIREPFIINDHEIQISASVGLAWLPKDGNMPDTIVKHADLAMYQAKEMGRNQYRQFTEQLHDQLQSYISFSREMPVSLSNGDFSLAFQPKMDLLNHKIIGVEALVRWEHPELGKISPVDFISIAEETGFIVPLGGWIFEEACRNMKILADQGYGELTCAINLSSRQFRDPSLLDLIMRAIEENQISPAQLEVEITETLLMKDVDQAIVTLKKIQDLGISVAIDDFGTGYSSFSYLKTLPINVLKIDRCFIHDIPRSKEDMNITSAIISMAQSLNLKVVAEGIETTEQQEFLVEQYCDIGQGYLFGKPVKLEKLIELLDS